MQFAAEHDENGRRLVVRNGYHHSGEVLVPDLMGPLGNGIWGRIIYLGLIE